MTHRTPEEKAALIAEIAERRCLGQSDREIGRRMGLSPEGIRYLAGPRGREYPTKATLAHETLAQWLRQNPWATAKAAAEQFGISPSAVMTMARKYQIMMPRAKRQRSYAPAILPHVHTSLDLPPDLHAALVAHCDKTGKSQAQVVREALRSWV